MNWTDIVILAVIVLSCLFGLWRGLIREVFSLVTWVAALIVARLYSSTLAPLLTGVFEGETTRYVAAFTLLFVITIIVGSLITHLLSKILTLAGLKFTDRLLGGVFGAARGGIIVMHFLQEFNELLAKLIPNNALIEIQMETREAMEKMLDNDNPMQLLLTIVVMAKSPQLRRN